MAENPKGVVPSWVDDFHRRHRQLLSHGRGAGAYDVGSE